MPKSIESNPGIPTGTNEFQLTENALPPEERVEGLVALLIEESDLRTNIEQELTERASLEGLETSGLEAIEEPDEEEPDAKTDTDHQGYQKASLSENNDDERDILRSYLHEIKKIPLLTRKEEIQLAQTVEKGLRASKRMLSNHRSPALNEKLIRDMEEGRFAREALITANRPLVVSIAKRYAYRGVSFLDRIQEGNIGLIRAAQKFNYQRGNKFSTHATWWIRHAITLAIADHGRTIRVPVGLGQQMDKMYHIKNMLIQKLGRNPNPEELAEEMKIPVKKIKRMILADRDRRLVSLETPVSDNEESVIGDFIEDKGTLTPEQHVEKIMQLKALKEALNTLDQKEAYILRRHYGLDGRPPCTLEEIGIELGNPRTTVLTIEKRALGHLRTCI